PFRDIAVSRAFFLSDQQNYAEPSSAFWTLQHAEPRKENSLRKKMVCFPGSLRPPKPVRRSGVGGGARRVGEVDRRDVASEKSPTSEQLVLTQRVLVVGIAVLAILVTASAFYAVFYL
ncbi:hypothetical protein LR948_17560, partial [Roseivivax sp. GX 12232]|uniref:hypothetical protein n=1 Tax=Roseivivax sp. GX 12232 TaxID=2900547 RepID=UPI001E4A5B45